MDDRVDPDPSVKKRVLRALVNIKNQLEEKRKNINTEIGNYPAPIPACDAQFNYLLEMRSQASSSLKLLDDLLTAYISDSRSIEIVDKLSELSARIDKVLAEQLAAAFELNHR